MPQIRDNELAQTAFTVALNSEMVLKLALFITFLINQALSSSYCYMIALIRCLQMILHIPLLNVVVPGNITMIFRFIIPIVMFDILENERYNYDTFL